MNSNRDVARIVVTALAAAGIVILLSAPARAHCDGLDGPVVKAAQDALLKGDVNLVLIWVRAADELEIRRAFAQATAVRKLSPQAAQLADTYFFETLVRIHRTGEGAPFTGLKPAGRNLGPAIPAADLALASGDASALTDLMLGQVRKGLLEAYSHALAARRFKPGDTAAGRDYVERYVAFIHFVEAVSAAATHSADGHYPEGAGGKHNLK